MTESNNRFVVLCIAYNHLGNVVLVYLLSLKPFNDSHRLYYINLVMSFLHLCDTLSIIAVSLDNSIYIYSYRKTYSAYMVYNHRHFTLTFISNTFQGSVATRLRQYKYGQLLLFPQVFLSYHYIYYLSH